VLDLNELATGQASYPWEPSKSVMTGICCLPTDNTGFRRYTLAVKGFAHRKLLVDHAERVDRSLGERQQDALLYVEDEVSKRSYQVVSSRRGHERSATPSSIKKKTERFDISASKTRSKAYLLLASGSHTTSEARYIRRSTHADWKVMEPRKQGVEVLSRSHGNFFYLRVNDRTHFRLVRRRSPIQPARIGQESCRIAPM